MPGLRLLRTTMIAFSLSLAAYGLAIDLSPALRAAQHRPVVVLARHTSQPALLEQRLLVLDWPETMRENDSDGITLAIDTGETTLSTGTPKAAPGDIYATHNVLAVARLELAGLETRREDVREPLLPGRPTTFRWTVRAGGPGVYRGTIWLHLQLVPKNNGPVDELLILARPIEIRVVNVMGLPGNIARILGGVGIVISALLGYPLLRDWRLLARR